MPGVAGVAGWWRGQHGGDDTEKQPGEPGPGAQSVPGCEGGED